MSQQEEMARLKAASPRRRGGRGPMGRMMPGEKAQDFKGTIGKLVRFMGQFKVAFIAAIVFAMASAAFNIVGPKVLSQATTELFDGIVAKIGGTGGINFDAVGAILLATLALYCVSAACSFVQGWMMTSVSQRTCYGLRRQIAEKIDRLPVGYFERTSTGDVLSRITNDVDTLGQSLNQGVTQLITSATTMIGVLVMMLSINVEMTLIALLVIPLSLILVKVVVKRSQRYFRAQQKKLGEINGQIEETFSGQAIVRAFNNREVGFLDTLDSRMKYQDDLRFKMIALAIRDNDFEMLSDLHAREIPLLYTINPIQHWTLKDKQLPSSSNVEQMINSIAASKNTAISYFFEEFDTAELNSLRSTFVFPYAGQVLDALISSKRTFESKLFLEKAIEHNKKVQRKLQKLVDKSKVSCKELYSATPNNNYYDEAYFRREAWREYYFYPENGFIAYYMPFYSKNTTGFITNVINVTVSSTDKEVQFLIDELKKTYNTFIKQYEKKEA